MSDGQIKEILAEIKKLFEQNKKARIVQIKTEEKILAKMAHMTSCNNTSDRRLGLDME